jgi:hypothetical protein
MFLGQKDADNGEPVERRERQQIEQSDEDVEDQKYRQHRAKEVGITCSRIRHQRVKRCSFRSDE